MQERVPGRYRRNEEEQAAVQEVGHRRGAPGRRFALFMVFAAFYEQLSWTPILVLVAAAAGNPSAVAYAASAYSASNLVGNALFGLLADRAGRARVAGCGFGALAVSALLHLAVRTPAGLVGVRLLHGLAAAAVAPAAFASLSQGVPRERRGEVMARAGLLIALASMLAPPVTGGLEGALGLSGAILILAAGVGAVGAAALLRAASAPAETVSAAGSGGPPAGTAAGAPTGVASGAVSGAASASPAAAAAAGERTGARRLDVRLLALSCAVGFAVMFCQNILFYAFPLKARGLGLPAAATGGMLSAFAVGAAIAFLPPLSRLSDRAGRVVPIAAGLATAAAGFLTLSAVATIPWMAAALFLYGLGFGLIFPSVSALSADAAGEGRRGLAFGMLTASFSAGAIAGPLVTQGMSAVATPFTVGGLLLLLTLALGGSLALRRR